MSPCTPWRVPLSMVSVRKSGLAPPAMTAAEMVASGVWRLQVQERLERARLLRQRPLLLQLNLQLAHLGAQPLVFPPDVLQRHVLLPRGRSCP